MLEPFARGRQLPVTNTRSGPSATCRALYLLSVLKLAIRVDQAEAALLGDDSPFLQGPPQLQGLLREKNPSQEQRRRAQAHQAARSPEPEQQQKRSLDTTELSPTRMTRQRSTSSAPLSGMRERRSASAVTAPPDGYVLSASARASAPRTSQEGADATGGGARAGDLAAGGGGERECI